MVLRDTGISAGDIRRQTVTFEEAVETIRQAMEAKIRPPTAEGQICTVWVWPVETIERNLRRRTSTDEDRAAYVAALLHMLEAHWPVVRDEPQA